MAKPPGDDATAHARLRVHLQLIEDGVGPVVAQYREHIQCRPGCSDCCQQTFSITEVEGSLLREGLAATDEATRADIVARAQAWQPAARVPCPVLSNQGECRLYAHRPRICRKYGIPLWHPDRPDEVTTCKLNFVGVADLDAALVLEPQAHWATDWIALRKSLGLGKAAPAPIAHHLRR